MFNFNLISMKKNYWLCKTFLLAAMGLSSVAIQGYASSDVLSVAGIEQQKTIQVTGAVEDTNGIPVVGASVVVKGTTNGTVTDMDGNFKLSAPAGSTLVITFIGSLGIELIQLIFKMGMFELDDVIHNVLGAVLGSCLYMMGNRARRVS